jgi:hypothetical protein
MDDLSSFELKDIRALLSEIFRIYMEAARSRDRGTDTRLQAAQLAERACCNYLKFIDAAELDQELRQMERFIVSMRQPRFED